MKEIISTAARLARVPALHFAVVGAVLFTVHARLTQYDTAALIRAREPITVSRQQIEQLRSRFMGLMGTAPTPEQLQAMVDQTIDEEILYHEARARGLDQGDRHIRMRLIDKTKFITEDEAVDEDKLYQEANQMRLGEDDQVVRGLLMQKMRLALALPPPGGNDEVTEPELLAYREAHRDRFTRPARVAFTHAFLSKQRGDAALRDAQRLLEQLRAGARPADDLDGDAFPLGERITLTSQAGLATTFGQSFAEQVMMLEPGKWSQPLASTYGWHLVRVDTKEPRTLLPLDAVRNQILYGIRAERRELRVKEAVRRLRNKYEIRVEGQPQVAASESHRRGLL